MSSIKVDKLLTQILNKYADKDGSIYEDDIYNAINDVEKQIDKVYLIDIAFPNSHIRKFIIPK
jgi:adenine specific DNA methylase Mod